MEQPDTTFLSFLKSELTQARERVTVLQGLIDKETLKIQRSCEHEFVSEPNGDYHSPGYYYTCVKCNYWTNIRPRRQL